MKTDRRFVRILKEGKMNITEILVDSETGVNYIYHTSGYGGGLTPLLDENGNVVVTKNIDINQ